MVFLSKNNTYPFQEIDDKSFYDLFIDIKEEKDDIISKIISLYLIIDYAKFDQLIAKIENEHEIGNNMLISLLDERGNPLQWNKEFFIKDVNSIGQKDDRIIIPLKIKWDIINNQIFYNKEYFTSFINIYTDDKYLPPIIKYTIKNKYFTETSEFYHTEQYIFDITTPNIVESFLSVDNNIIKITKQSEKRYIIDIGFFEEEKITGNFVLKIHDVHNRYAKEEFSWNIIGYIPTKANIIIKDIRNNLHDYFIDNQQYFIQIERTDGNSDILDTLLTLSETNNNLKIKKDSVFNYILSIGDLDNDLNLKLQIDVLEENFKHVLLEKEILINNYQFPNVDIIFLNNKNEEVNELIDNISYDIQLIVPDSKIKIIKSEILEYSPKNLVYVGIIEDFKYRVYIQKLIENNIFNIKFNIIDEYNNINVIEKSISIIHQQLTGL